MMKTKTVASKTARMIGKEKVFEIHFSDLVPQAQKELLRFFKVQSAEQMNWDVFATAELTKDEDT